MTTWTSDELTKIGTAEELEIASLRQDDRLRKSTTIWVVRVGDDLYVRSVNGRESAWFRGTQVRHQGHVQEGGLGKDVTFVDVDNNSDIGNQIDTAYRTKYQRYAGRVLDSTLTPKAQTATLKLVPRA